LTWRQIGLALGIAPDTVQQHLFRARKRLDADNTTNAVVKAIARKEIRITEILSLEGNDAQVE